MSDERILLILGAGASYPYNLPLGRELLFQTVKDLSRGSDVQIILSQMGHNLHELKRFANELLESNQPSIDAFIYYRKEYEELGRLAIAAELIKRENEHSLRRKLEEEWYEYLFAKLITQDDAFPAIRLEVITFNYDRSLERFLELALRGSLGVNAQEASALRRKVPIHHIYGDLGALPEEGATDYRPYSSDLNGATLETAAKRICLLGEERNEEKPIAIAKAMVSKANKIAFLGFAFHPLNVDQLGLDVAPTQSLFATIFRSHNNESNRIRSLFPGRINTFDFDCISFLRAVDIVG